MIEDETVKVAQRFGLFDRTSGQPVHQGRWLLADGAKQMQRKIQREMSRKGYNRRSEDVVIGVWSDDK